MAERIKSDEFRRAVAVCLDKIKHNKPAQMQEDLNKEGESLLSMMEEPLDDTLNAQQQMHKNVYNIQFLNQKLHGVSMPA